MVQGVRVCASGRYLHHAVLADYHAPVGGLGFVPAPLAPGRRRGGGLALAEAVFVPGAVGAAGRSRHGRGRRQVDHPGVRVPVGHGPVPLFGGRGHEARRRERRRGGDLRRLGGFGGL
jgi:hypothetical protein